MQHANVVRVFDFIEDDGTSPIVMEFVEGETLADRRARVGSLPFDEAIELGAQICDGLAAAHPLNLVHRDLQPANIVLTDEGLAKVLDFGIAKRTGHVDATLTQTGAVVGTPQYMAPEQLNGDDIDARADVHSVGLLLVEMLTGKPVFSAPTIAKLMYQITSEETDLSALVAANSPADVVAIVRCALQKDREDRWPDARPMGEALRVVLYGDVIRSRRTPTPVGLHKIVGADGRSTPIPGPRPTSISASPTPTPSTVPAPKPARSIQTLLLRVRRRKGTMILLAAVCAVSAVALSRIVLAFSEPKRRPVVSVAPPASVVQGTPGPPDTIAPAQEGPAPVPSPTAAEQAELRLRTTFGDAVQAKWRLFSRPVSEELGPRMNALRTEFIVRLDAGGQLADVRTLRLSGVATCDENPAVALQNVDRLSTGRPTNAAGWTWRVAFAGKNVRVRPLKPR